MTDFCTIRSIQDIHPNSDAISLSDIFHPACRTNCFRIECLWMCVNPINFQRKQDSRFVPLLCSLCLPAAFNDNVIQTQTIRNEVEWNRDIINHWNFFFHSRNNNFLWGFVLFLVRKMEKNWKTTIHCVSAFSSFNIVITWLVGYPTSSWGRHSINLKSLTCGCLRQFTKPTHTVTVNHASEVFSS